MKKRLCAVAHFWRIKIPFFDRIKSSFFLEMSFKWPGFRPNSYSINPSTRKTPGGVLEIPPGVGEGQLEKNRSLKGGSIRIELL